MFKNHSSYRRIAISLALMGLFAAAIVADFGSVWARSYGLFAGADISKQTVKPGDIHMPPPSNDTFAGAIALTLNRSVTGSFGTGANSSVNDYHLSAPGSPTCFAGNGQVESNAPGRDLVYSFTAPSAGTYSFRVGYTGETDNENLVIYLVSGIPPGQPPLNIPCQEGLSPAAIAAANRNTETAQPSEEIFDYAMTSGQQLFLVVDENVLGTTATGFYVEVFDAALETEPNDTFATSQPIACSIEGRISNAPGPVQDLDYFSIGTPPDGSRLFVIVDGAASANSNFDMRINNASNTYQFADFYNDIENGTTSPNIAGLPLASANGPYAIQIDYNGTTNTAVHEPYRMAHVIQPPSSAAVAESEPNDTLSTADSDVTNYFSGVYGSLADSDWYATVGNAGDLLFVSVDNDPGRNGNNANGNFELYDSSGNLIYSLEDNSNITTTGFPPVPGQTSTTPVAPAEATLIRLPVSGVYYIRLFAASVNATGPNDYLLSISKNCATGGGGVLLPGDGSLQFSSPSFDTLEGGPATINVSRAGGTISTVTVNYATSNGTATGGASCAPGIDFINTSGTLTFVPGDALESFTVIPCNDNLNEGNETITLTLSMPTGGAALGSPNPATLNLADVASQFIQRRTCCSEYGFSFASRRNISST